MSTRRGECTHGYPLKKKVTPDGWTEESSAGACPVCPPDVVQERYRVISACASVERSDFPSAVSAIYCEACKAQIKQNEPFYRETVAHVNGDIRLVRHADAKHCPALAAKNGECGT